MKYKKIALIGMMGSGKTAVAKELSEIIKVKLFEMDDIFEKKYQIKIKDFFKNFGEDKFRECENNILNEIIKNDSYIISTGGGIILNPNNREILFKKNIKTIYLKTNPDIIFERIKKDKNRPLLLVDNPKEEIKKILAQREAFYNKANITIQTDNKTIKEIAEEINKNL